MVQRRKITLLGVELTLGPAFAIAAILALLVVAPQPWHQLTLGKGYRMVDLDVYRSAGLSLLHHRPVYSYLTPAPQNLPFTYPPTSALLAVPLALVPLQAANVLWEIGCYVLLLLLVLVSFRSLLRSLGPERAAIALPALWVVMAYLLPVRSVVRFGQVGLILAALCLADCLTPDSRIKWPRGALIGLAAATKLTPAVFIPYLWLSGRRKAAYTAVATIVGLIGVTWLIAPGTSKAYWTDALFSSDRLGNNNNTSNQALRGFLLRTGLPHHTESLLWLLLVAVVGGIGLIRAAGASKRGNELAGVAITGLLTVLLSPVAWIHHLVWVVLVIGVIVGTGRNVRRLAAAAVVTIVFSLSIPWWADSQVLHHIPKRLISYQLPGTTQWIQMPEEGAPKVPQGTHFRSLLRDGTYRGLSDQTADYMHDCGRPSERNCVNPRMRGKLMWVFKAEQSAYTFAAIALVLWLPTRRPEDELTEQGSKELAAA